jgi:ketosteroid isomerase-like protein
MGAWILRGSLSVLLIATAFSTSLLGQRDPQKANETGVEQAMAAVARVEAEWLNALNKADLNAIAEVLGDDFIGPDPNSGQFVNKADLLRFYRSHLSPEGPDQRRIENLTVSVYGATALARGVLTTRDAHGQVIRKLLFTDVFVLRKGKWQAVSAQENLVALGQAQAH